MEEFFRLFNYVDLFGIYFQFNIYEKNMYKTKVSTVLTLIFFIFTISFITYNLVILASRTDIKVNSYDSTISEKEFFLFNDSNAFLGFDIFDYHYSNVLTNSPLITYNVTYYYIDEDGNSNIEKINLVNCNNLISKYWMRSQNGRDGKVSNDAMCVAFNNTKFGGNYYGFREYSYLDYQIKFNYSEFLNKVHNFTFPLNFFLYYPISEIDLYNYSIPYTTHLGYIGFTLYYNKTNSQSISYDITDIYTDQNLILKSNIKDQVISFNYNYLTNQVSDISNLFEFTFYVNPLIKKYYRNYMKFQDVLNNVSSVYNIVLIILGIIGKTYNTIKLKHSFIEDNFLFKRDFKKNEKSEKNFNGNSKKKKTSDVPFGKKSFEILETEKNEILDRGNNLNNFEAEIEFKDDHEKQTTPRKRVNLKKFFQKNIDERENEEIRFSKFFLYMIKNTCCQKQMKEKEIETFGIYNTLLNHFDQLIDVNNIFLKMDQLENLQNLFLSEEQREMLKKSKIVFDLAQFKKEEIDKIKRENVSFHAQEKKKFIRRLKTKIETNKMSKIDFLLLNKIRKKSIFVN